jgi:hypothetical protein
MVYSPIMGAFRLTPEESSGQPNYMDALKNAFIGLQSSADTAYKPSSLAEQLLGQQLTNKINAGKAKYAEEDALTDLRTKQGNLGLQPLRQRLLEAQIAQSGAATDKNNLINNLYKEYLSQGQNGGGDNNPRQSNMSSQSADESPLLAQDNEGVSSTPMIQSARNNKQDYRQALVRHLIGLPSEMPHEKMEREISTSNINEQNKLNVKRAQQLRESAKDLELAGLDVSGIHDILSGPDSLGTGITKTLVGKLGWGSEKLGAFNERALRLQAQMARALSSRGGEGAAKIVAGGKPSTWKSTRENLGITDAYADRIKNEFELLNQEYKNITGKELPYSLPQYVHNIGRKIDGNIFKPKTDFGSEQEYHDYMASLKPSQRKLAVKALRESSR